MSEYKSVQGDTWDLIAYKIWKNEFYSSELIKANPKHKETVFFSSGITLTVPEIIKTETSVKPPWR